MQDQDAPPVEGGETGGGVVVVRLEAIPAAVAADPPDVINSMAAAFIARPWTTAIERQWAEATGHARAASGQGFQRTIRSLSRIPCPSARMPTRAYSVSWMTFSFRRRFRKPRAS